MTQTTAVEDEMDNISYTIGIRREIITQLINTSSAGGERSVVPVDKDEKALLVKALDGIDRATVSRARVKIEENNSKQSEEQTQLVAKFLSQLSPQAHRNNQGQRTAPIPQLPSDIPPPDMVEGERTVGVEPITYNEIFSEDSN